MLAFRQTLTGRPLRPRNLCVGIHASNLCVRRDRYFGEIIKYHSRLTHEFHCGTKTADSCLTLEVWQSHWTVSTWHDYLGEMKSDLAAIRQCTHTGRPLGTGEFVRGLDKIAHRRLAPQKRGRR